MRILAGVVFAGLFGLPAVLAWGEPPIGGNECTLKVVSTDDCKFPDCLVPVVKAELTCSLIIPADVKAKFSYSGSDWLGHKAAEDCGEEPFLPLDDCELDKDGNIIPKHTGQPVKGYCEIDLPTSLSHGSYKVEVVTTESKTCKPTKGECDVTIDALCLFLHERPHHEHHPTTTPPPTTTPAKTHHHCDECDDDHDKDYHPDIKLPDLNLGHDLPKGDDHDDHKADDHGDHDITLPPHPTDDGHWTPPPKPTDDGHWTAPPKP